MPFIPHTAADESAMLKTIGIDRIDALFEEIPKELLAGPLDVFPEALGEMAIGRLMSDRAARDGRNLNFIGAGAYDHHIPAAVWSIVTRGEIYSAYTPYQAEASQGTLQTIFEYQTMIAGLTGMEVSNASLYDGASALAEACLMAVRIKRSADGAQVLLPQSVHPVYRRCVDAICGLQGVKFTSAPYDPRSGQVLIAEAEERLAGLTAVVIQNPNFFGQYEDVDQLTDWAHGRGALVIAVVNPVSLALVKPPGEWGQRGADIVVGEGQPLGVPLSGGGPYFGFMTTRMEHVRQMPGRIVGRTLDLDGRTGYALTLQAREQHIRRSKATSNICTNQGLLMSAATIYLSIVGPQGLTEVAAHCIHRTEQLARTLTAIPGVEAVFSGPRFHEVVLRLDVPVAPVLEALAAEGIVGGYDLSGDYPELGHALLICATETRNDADIACYRDALKRIRDALLCDGGSRP
jgi:glycine dehydrogenase subunit 1